MQPITNLVTALPAAEVVNRDFPDRAFLPVEGGWGYSRETACIISRQLAVARGLPLNAHSVEREFVARRLWEEMIVTRAPGERYADIRWTLRKQAMRVEDNRRYDRLQFDVTALPEGEFVALKTEWLQRIGDDDFDPLEHARRHQAALLRREVEYWFDISSFMPAGD